MTIVYDGLCPFCSNYARLTRLRVSAGPITLIDARDGTDPVVIELMRAGVDFNETMAVRAAGAWHTGGEAVAILAALSAPGGVWRRLHRRAFASPRRARLLYGLLRTGRNLTLRALGRPPIG